MTETFADLGLGEGILRAVADAGYTKPTPIQQKAIPYVLMGRDILGCAQTGTGKTASFTLPMIDILAQGRARARMPRTVILEPTRELAAQVAENFDTYGKYNKLTMALLIGGVSFNEQEKLLDRGVDVLIATPGRLLDHCERGKVILTDTKVLVIDEADRMLDMGFIPDVERIVGLMPVIRQTLMFSATMPPEIKKLADKFLMNPKEMAVDPPSSTADTVEQAFVSVSSRSKRKMLRDLIDREGESLKNALIFCNRKREVADLFTSLQKSGYPVGALHGDMDQYKRMEWLEKFRTGDVSILICSDVAARGLDISTVSHVFNVDVPNNAEDYVHRIGRTGRAGRLGKSITLVTKEDDKLWAAVKKMVGKDIPEIKMDGSVELSEGAAETEERSPRRPSRSRSARSAGRSTKPAPSKEAVDGEESNQQTPARDVADNDAPSKEATNKPDRSRGRKEPRKPRRGRGEHHDIGELDEMTVPFGQSDQLPAFLRR
jgi:superfamily II DNA/RNA helicase